MLFLHLVVHYSTYLRVFLQMKLNSEQQHLRETAALFILSLFWSENVPQTPDLFWCPLSPRAWRKAEVSSLGLSYLVPNIKTNLRRLNFCALKRLWTETAANPWGSCLLELLPLLIHPFFIDQTLIYTINCLFSSRFKRHQCFFVLAFCFSLSVKCRLESVGDIIF